MKKQLLSLVAGIAFVPLAAQTSVPSDTFLIPERAILVSGTHTNSGDLIGVLYNTEDIHFSDPQPPRFLFIDRQGKVALGIGGTLKGTAGYYFNGEIDDGAGFTTFDIPVPNDPAKRQRFYGDVSHSSIFLQLVGRTTKFGYYQMYVQTQFTGDNGGYGVVVKQAWASLGNVTMGLARSSFVDPSAGTPTIDSQGPSGEMAGKNLLVRYAKKFGKNWRFAISAEVPKYTTTSQASVSAISQRVPDIPVNIQYAWNNGASHVRLSGLVRNLYYRDMVTSQNRSQFGWAVQLSGLVDCNGALQVYYQGALGRGYGRYVNDLSGNGYDLVYSQTPGKMEAPKTLNYELGVRYNVTPNLFFASSFSQARLYDLAHLGPDTYRYGQYISASGFYNITSDLQVGLEYLHGNRKDFSGQSGKANRIEAMLKYNF